MDFLKELPEQIFRDILLRVSYKSQQKIEELLEPAKEMIECSQFYQDRIKFGLAKKYICLLHVAAIIIYDPVDQSQIIFNSSSTSTILIYDLLSKTWKQGAKIPTVRYGFASYVSPEGLIYVAGGFVGSNSASRKAAVYEVYEDEWEFLPDMHHLMTDCRGVFYEGIQRFDPNTSMDNNRKFVFLPSTGRPCYVWTTNCGYMQ
ncbi:F-box/kelch-repeat protein At1g80440-like [Cryptomeria japonica]|uniref:F-box/kelch-repeat protein At1g80440-like n=1 Tax=Cryptomeria japonica TaxID=3369 RepID=UPI0027D9DAB3|nr:F-box/kelch-repeat protein At1g80440-like [Cryptomeria japonica]